MIHLPLLCHMMFISSHGHHCCTPFCVPLFGSFAIYQNKSPWMDISLCASKSGRTLSSVLTAGCSPIRNTQKDLGYSSLMSDGG